MSKIQTLSEDIINKIAAGEVIERPASVVKELVENSLDANSTNITIEIKDAGKELIRVSDNGDGMNEEDAKKSIIRHATSKIRTAEDLYSIQSLGFRGEALASVSAVSRLTIITKEKSEVEGFKVEIHGGFIKSSGPAASDSGTSIEVKDLFYNTPARKKFLKSDLIELKHIIDIITRYALYNKSISFKLINEGRTIINSPSTPNMRANIASIYTPSSAKDLIKVSHEHFIEDKKSKGKSLGELEKDKVAIVQDKPETKKENLDESEYKKRLIKVHGYVSKPQNSRNDRTQQSIFVNGRWVKNDNINQAIYDAYHSLLFHGKHPIYVINIDLNPESIDVNVHPNKTQIKIEQKNLVYEIVYKAVYEALEKNKLIPIVDINTEQQFSFKTTEKEKFDWQEDLELEELEQIEIKKKSEISKDESKYLFEKSDQSLLNIESSESEQNEVKEEEDIRDHVVKYNYSGRTPKLGEDKDSKYLISKGMDEKSHSDEVKENVENQNKKILTSQKGADLSFFKGTEKLPPMRLLGQIHKTFFVAETVGGMLIIDQHVVQERVLYEKFMTEYLNRKVAVQSLLEKELLNFTAIEAQMILANLDRIKQFGFTLEHFGENDFLLSTTPTLFGRTQGKNLLYIIINEISEGGVKEFERIQEEIITRMSCRASVKAGDELSVVEMKRLLGELAECKLPYTCPHGRSIFIKITADELEKKFLRK